MGIVTGIELCGLQPVALSSGPRPSETAEHPFGTLKMRMCATHFLMKGLPKVATEISLQVLAYNLTRVMNIIGVNRSWQRSRHSVCTAFTTTQQAAD
jgi:hypothetical protein